MLQCQEGRFETAGANERPESDRADSAAGRTPSTVVTSRASTYDAPAKSSPSHLITCIGQKAMAHLSDVTNWDPGPVPFLAGSSPGAVARRLWFANNPSARNGLTFITT